MSVGRSIIKTSQKKNKSNTKSCYLNVIKKVLTDYSFSGIIKVSTKVGNQINRKKQKMENTLTVGSQFTTAKSKVSGVIQEVVQNKNGTFRVRLDVAGQPRWTTVIK
jgi:DUF917 family protein